MSIPNEERFQIVHDLVAQGVMVDSPHPNWVLLGQVFHSDCHVRHIVVVPTADRQAESVMPCARSAGAFLSVTSLTIMTTAARKQQEEQEE